ncbi:MAG: 5'-methylthioadenosine/adenosylhomocysteine nucleosidase [Clostridiales bacterium]|jgi:adenosylhomocysteine nucleosidase|nr:5'-methylthioadenosine/adenosylhomocysteine nucleosidase [Clostridiales bacterium]
MIGIIGALSVEIEGLLEKMEIGDIHTIGGLVYYTGEIAGKNVVLARCGVGKVNAAMCAQAMKLGFSVSAVINLGAAGAIDNALNIGDVVVATDLVHHDVNAGSFGYKPGQLPGMDVLAFSADKRLSELAVRACNAAFEQGGIPCTVHHGRIATGDQFIEDAATKQHILEEFGALCVEMEGAAIAQVCHQNKTPFVAIRAISDKADGSAQANFDEFVTQAAENSARSVMEMIGHIL